LKVDRDRSDLVFCTSLGGSNALGLSTVSEQVRRLPPGLGHPVAAVNGDFYNDEADYPGDPRDLQIHDGELISAPTGHSCFWVDPSGRPQMTNVTSRLRAIWANGTSTPFGLNEDRPYDGAVLFTAVSGASTKTSGGLELVLEPATNSAWLPLQPGKRYLARIAAVSTKGDTRLSVDRPVLSLGPRLAARLPKPVVGSSLELVIETIPDLAGVVTAIGGGPGLVRNGTAGKWTGFQMRHPRTAIGWNKDHVFLVEVDGRQGGLSVGMTLEELASYMVQIGCQEALNLDGGGSATFWLRGNVINSPSEGQERPGANALILVQKKESSDVIR